MKKIFIMFVVILMSVTTCFAKNKKIETIKFNGDKYALQYSIKSAETGGYLNEYYKHGESYRTWSEMLGIHHFPNAFSPIDQVVDFRKYLNSEHTPSALSFDDKNNTAMIDFIVINNDRLPIIIEFNVFKYVKNPKCGSTGIQYAKRYVVKTAYETEAAKKEIEKIRKKTVKKIKSLKAPSIVEEVIDIGPDSFKIPKDNKQTPVKNEEIKNPEENDKNISDTQTDEETEIHTDENTREEITEETTKEPDEEKAEIIPEPESNHEINVSKKEVIKETKEETAIKEDKKSDSEIKEEKSEQKKEVKENQKEKTVEKESVNNKKVKKEKEYKYENSKEDSYAKPRDYKQIRKDKKKQIKEEKRIKKLNAKKAKNAKKRAKRAAKKLEDK